MHTVISMELLSHYFNVISIKMYFVISRQIMREVGWGVREWGGRAMQTADLRLRWNGIV